MDTAAYQAIPIDINDYFAPSAPAFSGGGTSRGDGENRNKLYLIGGLLVSLVILLLIGIPLVHHKNHHHNLEDMEVVVLHDKEPLSWSPPTEHEQAFQKYTTQLYVEEDNALDEEGEEEGSSEDIVDEAEEGSFEDEDQEDAEEELESEDFYDDDVVDEGEYDDDGVEEDADEEFGN